MLGGGRRGGGILLLRRRLNARVIPFLFLLFPPSFTHEPPPQETGLVHWVLGTGDAGWKCFWLCQQHTCTHTQTGTHASFWVVAAAAAAAEQDSRPKKGKTAPHSGDAAATREREGRNENKEEGAMDRNRCTRGKSSHFHPDSGKRVWGGKNVAPCHSPRSAHALVQGKIRKVPSEESDALANTASKF